MPERWRIDKRVPAILMLTLLMQVGGGLVWAAQLNARVAAMEQYAMNGAALNEKFARLEERMDNVRQDLALMRRQLDQINNRLLGR